MSTPETNLSGAGAAASLTSPGSAVASQPMSRTMITLIRRELWEHRSLWITPLIVAAVIILGAFPVHVGDVTIGTHFDPHDLANADSRRSMFTLMLWGQTIPHYLVMSIVLSFYLLDCLYQERKDRSILFWKSLPVSDAATVLSKLLVGTVVVPLGVYLVAMVTGVVFQLIWSARAAAGALPDIAVVWDTVAWFKSQALMLYGLIVAILWYLPFAAFLLLVSAWARRNVFLWATLLPLIGWLGERLAFGTHYFGGLLEYRSWSGFWAAVFGPLNPEEVGNGRIVSLAELFDNVSMSRAFLNIDLWLGVAVAAVFVFAAIRFRRYRDDT
jgi:ABC-2 type transport system permease protein